MIFRTCKNNQNFDWKSQKTSFFCDDTLQHDEAHILMKENDKSIFMKK